MKLYYRHSGFKGLRTAFIISVALLILSSSAAIAQKIRSEAPPLKERLFFGGSFGLQFGTITEIKVMPVIGLWIFPRLGVAAGPEYTFYKDPSNRTDIFGGRAYAQFIVIQDLNSLIPIGLHYGFFLHAEDELLSLQSSFWKNPPYSSTRFFMNTPMAGVGVSQPIGKRSSLNLMVLWTLVDPAYSIYSNPEFRISFIF